MNIKELKLEQYPSKTYDKIRYRDTDRQLHVNNAVFSSFFETGRVEVLYNPQNPLYKEDCSFVIAGLNTNLYNEITWPGRVDIGTALTRIGNSSIQVVQGLFQNGLLCATAETVIVQTSNKTRKSEPLLESTKEQLSKLLIK